MKITLEMKKSDLKALDRDIDKLFTGIGRELASAPKMKPMVDKIRQGMAENSMKFSNTEVWSKHKEDAKEYGIIDFDSPLMVTGSLVNDFIFYAGKPKISQIPYSNEFILGYFTWAAKERRRPTRRHILNEIARKSGEGRINEEAEKFTYIKTSDLVKIISKSPRYPIMDSIASLYSQDIYKHCERLVSDAFKKRE